MNSKRTGISAEMGNEPALKVVEKVTPPTMQRKSEKGDASKLRVIEAALELFGTHGYEGTTTRLIAEKAGIKHPLLLYHFGSKEQLWISMMDHMAKTRLERLGKKLAECEKSDPASRLRIVIDDHVRFSASFPNFFRIMTMSGASQDNRTTWFTETYLRDYYNYVTQLIRQGQAEGAVREGDPARIYFGIVGLGGIYFSVASEFQMLTGKNILNENEIHRTVSFVYDFVFIN